MQSDHDSVPGPANSTLLPEPDQIGIAMAQNVVLQSQDLLPYIVKPDVLHITTEIQKLKLNLRLILWELACKAPLGIFSQSTSTPSSLKPPDAFYAIPSPQFPPVLTDYEVTFFILNSKDKLARQNFVWKYFGNCDPAAKYEIFDHRHRYNKNFNNWIDQMPSHIKNTIDTILDKMELLQEQLHSTTSAASIASEVSRQWRYFLSSRGNN